MPIDLDALGRDVRVSSKPFRPLLDARTEIGMVIYLVKASCGQPLVYLIRLTAMAVERALHLLEMDVAWPLAK